MRLSATYVALHVAVAAAGFRRAGAGLPSSTAEDAATDEAEPEEPRLGTKLGMADADTADPGEDAVESCLDACGAEDGRVAGCSLLFELAFNMAEDEEANEDEAVPSGSSSSPLPPFGPLDALCSISRAICTTQSANNRVTVSVWRAARGPADTRPLDAAALCLGLELSHRLIIVGRHLLEVSV